MFRFKDGIIEFANSEMKDNIIYFILKAIVSLKLNASS